MSFLKTGYEWTEQVLCLRIGFCVAEQFHVYQLNKMLTFFPQLWCDICLWIVIDAFRFIDILMHYR